MYDDCEELFVIHHKKLFKKISANTPITRHYFYTPQLLELLQREVKIKNTINPLQLFALIFIQLQILFYCIFYTLTPKDLNIKTPYNIISKHLQDIQNLRNPEEIVTQYQDMITELAEDIYPDLQNQKLQLQSKVFELQDSGSLAKIESIDKTKLTQDTKKLLEQLSAPNNMSVIDMCNFLADCLNACITEVQTCELN